MRGGAFRNEYGGEPYDDRRSGGAHAARRARPRAVPRRRGAHAAPRSYAAHRGVALAVGFVALVAWTLFAGPAAAASPDGPCAPQRTDVRHSEGVSWDPGYRRPDGDIDAVLLFLSFPDHRPDVATTALAADHFPATTEFFTRSSYGRLRLRPTVVRRWFTMPRPSTAYAIHRDWAPAGRDAYLRDAIAAVGPAVDFGRYPVVYLVADPDAPGVDSDATKVINFGRPLRAGHAWINRLVTVFERHPPDPNVLAHETNHVFDLPDLYHRPASGSTADWDDLVGDWDLMGSQFALSPDLFAWHRWRYGWIDRSQVTCVDHPGTVTRVLTPVETAGGAKLLVVRLDATTALAVEARAAAGNDVRSCTEGVLVYRVRSDVGTGDGPVQVLDAHPRTSACEGTSVYPPLADAPLSDGQTYRYRFGPWTHGALSVHAARAAAGAWRVTVTER
ncbi:M6 family metalloprotease domain-containing protein [Streptantibioticus silvisoli]|uniref:M6 family metalloprotease domain-containing protein n=1 Tax=Streptantibioticus silvisoli TaxID=2705255 RepID=UPI003F6CB9D6